MVVKNFGNVNQNERIGEKGFNKNLYVGIAIIIGLSLVAAFVYSNIPLAKTVTNTGTTADTAVTTMNTGPATSSQNAVTNGQETGSLLDQVKAALAPGAKIVYGNYGDGGSYGPYVCYCTEQNGQEIPDQRGFFTLQEYLSYLERVASSGAATSSQNAVTNGQETGSLLDQVKASLAPGAKIVYGNYGDAGYGPYVCYCTEQNGQLNVDNRGIFTLQEYLSYLERVNEANSGAATSSQNAVANGQENKEGTTSSPIVIDQWYPAVPYGDDGAILKLDRAGGITVGVAIAESGSIGIGFPTKADIDNYFKNFEPKGKHLLVTFNLKVKGDDNTYTIGPYAFGSSGVPGTKMISNRGWFDAFDGRNVNPADVTWQPVFSIYTEPPAKKIDVTEVK